MSGLNVWAAPVTGDGQEFANPDFGNMTKNKLV